MPGYNEIATCPVCEEPADPSRPRKFVEVNGTASKVHDKRPDQPPSTAISSDGPYLVSVHEICVDEFRRRVSAGTWPSE